MSIVLGVLMAMAVPVSALAPPYEQLPDGDTRPIIMSAELLGPQAHNALLEADLQIEAIDNDRMLMYWHEPSVADRFVDLIDGGDGIEYLTESLLLVKPIDLDYHAVNIVIQRLASFSETAKEPGDFFNSHRRAD